MKLAPFLLLRSLFIIGIIVSCFVLFTGKDTGGPFKPQNSDTNFSTARVYLEINLRPRQPNLVDYYQLKKDPAFIKNLASATHPHLESVKKEYIHSLSITNSVLKSKPQPAYLLLDTPPPSHLA